MQPRPLHVAGLRAAGSTDELRRLPLLYRPRRQRRERSRAHDELPGHQPRRRLRRGAAAPRRVAAWMPPGRPPCRRGSRRACRCPGMRITDRRPRGAAPRVWSNQPVTVAQIESDDSNEAAHSSGGTMLLPVHVLGMHYRVMTYPQAADAGHRRDGGTARAARPPADRRHPGRHHRHIHGPPAARLFVVDRLAAVGAGGRRVRARRRRRVPGVDRRRKRRSVGQRDLADLPVAVFSGNMSTTYGRVAAGVNSPDMAHEQIPPVAAWSHTYVAAALPPQADTSATRCWVRPRRAAPPSGGCSRTATRRWSSSRCRTGPVRSRARHDVGGGAAGVRRHRRLRRHRVARRCC